MHNCFYAPALQWLHVPSEQAIPAHHTEILKEVRLEVRATPPFPCSQTHLREHFGLRGCSWNADLRHWRRLLLLAYHWGLLRHSWQAGLGSDHPDLWQSWGGGMTYHPGGRWLWPRLCLWTLGCGKQRPELWHGRGWYQKNATEKVKASRPAKV